MLAKYFNGTAINMSMINDIPSANAMYRNVFSVFIILDYRYLMLDKSVFQIECFEQQTTNNKPQPFVRVEYFQPLRKPQPFELHKPHKPHKPLKPQKPL